MAMSLEQFDSATVLSKETSDENLYEVEAEAVEAQVASVREDGLTHFICLTFDIMFSCTRQRIRRSEREDQRQVSLTLEVQVAAQGCAYFTLLGKATLC